MKKARLMSWLDEKLSPFMNAHTRPKVGLRYCAKHMSTSGSRDTQREYRNIGSAVTTPEPTSGK